MLISVKTGHGVGAHGWRSRWQREIERAEPMAAQAEAGNVLIVKGAWNEHYLEELCSFPYGSNADQVDASSRAFNGLMEAKAGYQQNIVGLY